MVISLDVAHAVAVDQPVEGLREIVPRARGAEVEEVASVLDNARSGPVHERVLGEGPCERGPHADHLGLDPEAGREAAAADVLQDAGQPPVAEARGRRAPLADAVPPVAPVVVPAGVDAEVLRSGLGRRVDEQQEPVRLVC